MWAKQKRNVSPNYSCCSKKQFYVSSSRTHGMFSLILYKYIYFIMFIDIYVCNITIST